MSGLRLSLSSGVRKGKTFAPGAGAATKKSIQVYRYDPDTGEPPRLDTYEIDSRNAGPWCSMRSSTSRTTSIRP